MSTPYFPARPGDTLLSEQWNQLQIRLRDEIQSHTHSGADRGSKLTGDSIEPGTSLSVASVAVAETLSVGSAGRLKLLASGRIGIGTAEPGRKLHIQGASSGPFLDDMHDRPGLAITGTYPELTLFSGGTSETYGPTIRMGGYDSDARDRFKQWVIGTSARGATRLDFGFSDRSDPNPHAGINNYNGRTILTLLPNGNVGVGALDPQKKLDVRGEAAVERLSVDGLSALNGGASVTGTASVDGRLGIGTASPGQKLHIQGASSAPFLEDIHDRPGLAITGTYPVLTLFSGGADTTYGATIRMGGYDSDARDLFKQWVIGTSARGATRLDFGFSQSGDANPHAGINNYNGNTVLTLLPQGNVGIGTTAPTNTLDVRGNISATGNLIGSAIVQISDVAMKQDIVELDGVLEQVMRLRPVRFAWKGNRKQDIGFIAQDVEPLFPELVSITGGLAAAAGEPGGIRTLAYSGLGALAIAALKELKQSCEQRIAALQTAHTTERQSMQDRITALEGRLADLAARQNPTLP